MTTASKDKALSADDALLIASIAAIGRSLLVNGSDRVSVGTETVERHGLVVLMSVATEHITKTLGAERTAAEFAKHDVRIVGDDMHISFFGRASKILPNQPVKS